MPFQPWFAILICTILCLSGCMKAVEKKVTVPVPEKKIIVEEQAPYDPDLPTEYRELLRSAQADDWRIPRYFWPLPGDMRRREKREGSFTFWTGRQRLLS